MLQDPLVGPVGDDRLQGLVEHGPRSSAPLILSGTNVAVGDDLYLAVPMEELHLFDADSEKRLSD